MGTLKGKKNYLTCVTYNENDSKILVGTTKGNL